MKFHKQTDSHRSHERLPHDACVLECGGLDAALEGGCSPAVKRCFSKSNVIRKRRRASLAAALQDLAALRTVHGKNRQRENGFIATVEFIALLAIMVLLVTANARALYHLHREVRLLEQQQIKRLNVSETNSVATVHVNVANADSK